MMSAPHVYVHSGQPPFPRLCELTTASGVKFGWRMHDVYDGGFDVARTDPALAVPTYVDAVLSRSPGAYWRMGEASGNLADRTANANTMTAHGAPTYGAVGAIMGDPNTAVSLPGNAANYFEAANSASLNVADVFSVVAWVKKAADGAWACIVGRASNGYQVIISNANKLSLVKVDHGVIVAETGTITGTDWHMVAVTKNGATSALYVDGAVVTGAVTDQTISATGGVTQIGRNAQDTSAPWNGTLDEIAVFNYALSAGDIAALYVAGVGQMGFGQDALLALGNMIVVENTGLRPWVGFVQIPDWPLKSPTLPIIVKQAERVLAERTLPKGFVVSGSAGEIFRRCIVEVNQTDPTNMSPCDSPEPGPTLTLDLSDKTLLAAFNELADTAGMEWWLDTSVAPSGVTMTLYWSTQRGSDMSGQLFLREGDNLLDGDYKLDETQLAAEVRVVGGATAAGGVAMRPSATASLLPVTPASGQQVTLPDVPAPVTQEQIDRISPWLTNPASNRQVTMVRPTTTDQDTITTGASHALDKQYRGPEELSALIAITDPILPKFWLGDVLTYYAPSQGPNGIQKPFRVSEIIPSNTTVSLRGRADGGLVRPKYGALQGLKNDVEDLKRQTMP